MGHEITNELAQKNFAWTRIRIALITILSHYLCFVFESRTFCAHFRWNMISKRFTEKSLNIKTNSSTFDEAQCSLWYNMVLNWCQNLDHEASGRTCEPNILQYFTSWRQTASGEKFASFLQSRFMHKLTWCKSKKKIPHARPPRKATRKKTLPHAGLYSEKEKNKRKITKQTNQPSFSRCNTSELRTKLFLVISCSHAWRNVCKVIFSLGGRVGRSRTSSNAGNASDDQTKVMINRWSSSNSSSTIKTVQAGLIVQLRRIMAAFRNCRVRFPNESRIDSKLAVSLLHYHCTVHTVLSVCIVSPSSIIPRHVPVRRA